MDGIDADGWLPAATAEWMSARRWYRGKPRTARPVCLTRMELPPVDPGVRIRIYLLLDAAETPAVLYQVPVTLRTQRLPGADEALIGRTDAGYAYDAPHDPAFGRAVMALMSAPAVAAGTAPISGRRLGGRPGGTPSRSRVLSAEQSNTSIVLGDFDGDEDESTEVICKIFRTVHDGRNPDVVLQSALAEAGSPAVPRAVGVLEASWPDPGGGEAHGHLAFAQEFLPGAGDAWRLALEAAEHDEDFTGSAHALGATVARVHVLLARSMPTSPATPQAIAATIERMRDRLDAACRAVPEIAEYADAAAAVYRLCETARWPRLQRIHGDLHLGQVLSVPGRGWFLIDFEGEPLSDLRLRSMPEAPERDVAGMLRSFSYAAGSVTRPADAADWATASRGAFVAGYRSVAGPDSIHRELLDAFELDKAVYEARYEAGNRPAWLPIPLRAVRRLVSRSRRPR